MEKKCNCNEPYDPAYFQAGYYYCPIHDKLEEKKYPIGDNIKLAILKKHYFDYYRSDFPSDKRTSEVVNQALCIKEETEAIFKAMDEYAATQGPVWMKASERLPFQGGHVTWRWIDKTESYSGYDEKNGFIFGTGGARVDPAYYTEIEWLDESRQT